jgi:multicomponent Na+:H+ antiporter subunit E
VLGINTLLAIVWAASRGSLDSANLVSGFVFGYVVLWLIRPALAETSYFRKVAQTAGFVVFFTKELFLANLRVAQDVLSPRPRRRPGIVAVPLDITGEAEIAFLANVITLTPGSITLDVSPDRSTLYVHGMFVDDPETFRHEIKDGFERRIRELLR